MAAKGANLLGGMEIVSINGRVRVQAGAGLCAGCACNCYCRCAGCCGEEMEKSRLSDGSKFSDQMVRAKGSVHVRT